MSYKPATKEECLDLIYSMPAPQCNCHQEIPTDEAIHDGTMWLDVRWCSEAMAEVIEPLVTEQGLKEILPLIEAELERDD